MVGLSTFAHVRLRGIEEQATVLPGDLIPGLLIIGRLHAVSIEGYSANQQHILEQDPAKMDQIISFIQQKPA